MAKSTEAPRSQRTAYELLAEFRRDWAYRIDGCSDPGCTICQNKKAFIARVEAFLKQEIPNG